MMKKWEEERLKKIYQQKIKSAKSIVNTNNKPGSTKKSTPVMKNWMRQSTSASSAIRPGVRNSSEWLSSPEIDPLTASKFSDIISEESSYEVSTMPVDQTLIFKLLQAFKLQQYAKKMQEFGFGMEIYKLAITSKD